MIFSALERIH